MTTQAARYELRQRGDLRVLAWPALDGLGADAMVTTRQGGVSTGGYATLNLSFAVGDLPERVAENRRRAAAALGADGLVCATQVHGAAARIVTAADRGRATVGSADALVTADPGTALAVLVADCVPIVLLDPRARVLAVVHAGWRGTVAGVAGAALAAMGTLGARPADVIAGLGPAISPDAYQVGEDVAAAAWSAFGGRAERLLRPDGTGRWLFDTWAANTLALQDAGVHRIHVAAVPTGGALFFSHRAARPCGRFAAIAWLVG
jgi:YfiH family protein